MFGAQLAAELGLPYAFASHFAPAQMMSAIQVYRSRFRPSEYLDRSRLMLGLNIVAAESEYEAQRLFTSYQHLLLRLGRGHLGVPHPLIRIASKRSSRRSKAWSSTARSHPLWWDHLRRFVRASPTSLTARPQTS